MTHLDGNNLLKNVEKNIDMKYILAKNRNKKVMLKFVSEHKTL